MTSEIKPVAWLCPVDDGDGPDISCNWEYASLFKGKADPLYTADALAAAREEGRLAGLEEAANVCEDLGEQYQDEDAHKWPEMKRDAESGCNACADAIRALKEKK